MKHTFYCLVVSFLVTCTVHLSAQNCNQGELTAFPSAMGYGRFACVNQPTKTAYHVTNLNDSGTGSLRDALSQSNRYIIFEVAGTISLSSTIEVSSSNLYIAGQTAFQNGGEGITIRSDGTYGRALVNFAGDHMIVRYIRFRRGPGLVGEVNGDNIIFSGDHWIIDHCSISWGTDENVNSYNNSYGTFQNTISSECLYMSTHAKSQISGNDLYSGHSKGSLFGYTNNPSAFVTIYNNLFAHNDARAPKLASSGSTHEIVNNLMYNNRYSNIEVDDHSGSGNTTPMYTNVVKNLVIPGLDTRLARFMVHAADVVTNQIYMQGNIGVHRTNDNQPEWDEVGYHSTPSTEQGRSNTAFSTAMQAIYSTLPNALSLEQIILPDVGANLKLDAVDQRVINDVINRGPTTVKYVQGVDDNYIGPIEYYGIINDPSEVGGWPNLAPMTSPPADNDNDGIPNSWEIAHNLDPNNPADAIIDSGNGYPHIEIYLTELTGDVFPSGSLSCSANQTVAPTCNSSNGQATTTPTGGTAPYSYQWSNGQSSATATGLPVGSYTVTITDADNCTSTCSVSLATGGAPCNFICSVAINNAPTCGLSNGQAAVTATGGTTPYVYQWSNGQTTATASGLSVGAYNVTVTDANGYTSSCSIVMSDGSDLSCTIDETATPSPGASDGVVTVIPNGGTPWTNDPRTDLLASPDRLGYGANTTGGTNYVYVSNFAELRTALQTAGNYVLLDPSVVGTGIGFTNYISVASNTSLDGSLAPGSWLYPDFAGGFPSGSYMFNHFGSTNIIIHSIELRGERGANHPAPDAGAFNIRGSDVWYDHVTITNFNGGGVRLTQGGNNLSLSNMKIVNTNSGVWLYFPNNTPRYVSLFNSEINATQLTPYNEGASHFHMWNNYIHGAQYGAALTGIAGTNSVGQNGPVRTLSENNVFSNNSPYAENGLPTGGSFGGPVQIPGFIYANGSLYKNGDTTNGNIVSGNAPWTIPYAYTTMNANQVEAYVATNAGKITTPPGGNPSYSYLWNNGQTTVAATGLSSGTYHVTVTDAANCTTVCSIVLTGACAPGFANGNGLTGTQATSQDFETDGVIESNQVITNNSFVDYDSGMSVLLQPSFEVISGATFHAFIDGCGGAFLQSSKNN